MRIHLVSTGDEVLRGEILDTNTAHAAALLTDHGLTVGRHLTCGDDPDELVSTLRSALDAADAVITCGGLGPTQDDRTAEALASVLGVELQTDENVLASLIGKLQAVGVPVTANQKRQALLPEGARAIDNPAGTAPGIQARRGETWIFCLPGPPAEFRSMLEGPVLDRLVEARGRRAGEAVSVTRLLRVFGKGEGWVADALGPLEEEVPGLRLGFQAAMPEVLVKLRAQGRDRPAAEEILDAAEKLARERLGPILYAVGDTSLAATVLGMCAKRGLTLAVAESCTGGWVGKLLTDVPGSSAVLTLSAVTYANEMKRRLLDVPASILEAHGAVSAECAQAMAEGVRRLAGADLSVAVTGIAGPDGGTAQKPVGTVFFAVSDARGTVTRRHLFAFRDRAVIRKISAFAALALIRRRLLEEND